MNKDNLSIRAFTRNQLSGNYWQAIVATIIPGVMFAILAYIIGLVVGQSFISATIITLLLSILSTFMICNMSLNIAKEHHNAGFEDSLKPSKQLISAGIYVILFSAISYAVQLPVNKVFFDSWIVSKDIIANQFVNISNENLWQTYRLVFGYYGSSILMNLVLLFITYKIMYVPFIIIDQGLTLQQAFSTSFTYTKGNFWRIIGMNLFFIGWYFISIFTCGILLLYVIPYARIAAVNLYLEIKEENGLQTGRVGLQVETDIDALGESAEEDIYN